jgi:TrmH family RNA methyltransferase
LLQHPQEVIAIFRQPEYSLDKEKVRTELTLLLDEIQDPGNLGTIIRLADWFGINQVICSPNTVDIYNPKTIQATMGALAHVNVFYTPLPEFLEEIQKDSQHSGKKIPVYGTFLDGSTIYGQVLSPTGLIVMGNEGNGISPELASYITHRLYIPNYPQGKESTESLNVAVATAITCAEFRRQQVYAV